MRAGVLAEGILQGGRAAEKIKMPERFVQNLHDKGKEKTCGNPFFEVYC